MPSVATDVAWSDGLSIGHGCEPPKMAELIEVLVGCGLVDPKVPCITVGDDLGFGPRLRGYMSFHAPTTEVSLLLVLVWNTMPSYL